MRGACPAFHQTCNNCHKEEHFANVCMSTNKSLNYLGNHITPPATAGEALDGGNFFIDAIFDIPNEVKNKSINKSTQSPRIQNAEWSVTLNTNGTNSCYKINSGAQVNVIPENQIETLQTKPRITKSTTTLSAYNGSNIPVKGKCTLDLQRFIMFL